MNGFDPAELAVRARFEWRPELTNFPASATTEEDALFFVKKDGFLLSVEARASGKDGVGFDALAELSDFGLNLFPGESLLKLGFDRLAFRASSGRKPEIDVVFTGMEWQGVLGFIETLKEIIPFDGFSDPPYVDVSTEGVTAGFDLALPERRHRGLQPREHQPRRRRARAVPRRRRHRRLLLLHAGEAVPPHGHVHRRRRLRRAAPLAQGPRPPRGVARGRRQPVGRPGRGVGLGVGLRWYLPAP